MSNPTDIVERLREIGCDREPFTPDHAGCVCRLANEAAGEIDRLRLQKTGLEALLSDGQEEIGELKHDIARHVAICSQQAEEIDRLRAALVPFAEAYRMAHLTGLPIGNRWCESDAFARAAELIPPEIP